MFPKPELAEALKGLVLVELYTDANDAVDEANQKLQEERFATIATPFYAILNPDEKLVASFDRRTSDAGEFLGFLKTRPGGLQSGITPLPVVAAR
jgi:thiol:disulfide interchange protein DsbD